jgi:hypothetical protein
MPIGGDLNVSSSPQLLDTRASRPLKSTMPKPAERLSLEELSGTHVGSAGKGVYDGVIVDSAGVDAIRPPGMAPFGQPTLPDAVVPHLGPSVVRCRTPTGIGEDPGRRQRHVSGLWRRSVSNSAKSR